MDHDKFYPHRPAIFCGLSQVRGSPHVVDLLGGCNTTIVTEAGSNDLENEIHKRTKAPAIEEVVSMSLDAARGLTAFHEASETPIVHFDIKASQVQLL